MNQQRIALSTLIIFLSISLISIQSFAVPVMIQKNVVIRSVEGGRAVRKGPYVLKAGSVIDIPDQYIVRNTIGDIDLTATLLNWRTSDTTNGIFSVIGEQDQIVGQEAFFKLNIISAAPGSNLPKNGVGFVALDFLARSRALKVQLDSASGIGVSEKTSEKTSGVPLPTPRPDPNQDSDIPVPTPRPNFNPQGGRPIDPLNSASGSGGGTAGVALPQTAPIPTGRSSKQEILQPDTTSGPSDLVVLESTGTPAPNIPIPTPRPTDAGSAAARVNQASQVLSGAGTSADVCPSGDCSVGLAGTDNDDKLVCQQISKGNFPASLNEISLDSEGRQKIDSSLAWIGRALRAPQECKKSCDFQTSGILSWLSTAKSNLNSFCDKTRNCASRCSTSELIPQVKCSNEDANREKECMRTCSPYMGLDQKRRGDHLKRIFDRVSGDIESKNPEFSRKMKSAGIFDNMDQRLLCLNKRRENVDLEPLDRNCASTAIGIGQVLKGTFYYGFGLANNTQQKNCINMKLKDLESKCRGWDKRAFRSEVYSKYMDFTPQELYDRRTSDVELQARSSYATFLDKLRLTGFDLNKAYRNYFGKSDRSAINRIENCVRTGQ